MRMKSTSRPDGKFAWLLCTMSFLNYVIIGGFVYASGIFYVMFKKSLDVTDGEVALITSNNIGVIFSIGPFVGTLCDWFSCRSVAVVGAAIATVGLASSAFSAQSFHLYITYGVIAGAGLGIVNVISIPILDPYFHKYKRTALSIALAGCGFGSFIIPPILKFLEDIYGWRGAILLMAGINAHMMVTCSLFQPFEDDSHRDVPIQDTVKFEDDKHSLKRVTNPELAPGLGNAIKREALERLALFRIIPFVCLCVYVLMTVFTHSLVTTHFGSYLISLQCTSEDVVKLYMAMGIAATIARPMAGVLAEVTRVNSALFIVLTSVINGALTVFVPLIQHLWMLYTYAVIYQLLMGPYFGLAAPIVMEHVPKHQVTTAYGMLFIFCIPGSLLGAPVGAWLYEYTHVYTHCFYLVGSLITLSGLIMVPGALYIHNNTHCTS